MTFTNKFDERSERMSIRVPLSLKNHIWARARRRKISATDVVIDVLMNEFKGQPPAPKWQRGSTKGGGNDKSSKEDVFA